MIVAAAEPLVLDVCPRAAHVVVAALEHHILLEGALDVAVIERIVDRGAQAYVVGEFTARCDNPCMVAGEHSLEFLAQRLVEQGEVVDF